MLQNTVMALPDKLIIFLGRTFSGHNHDYLMLKQELPPELDWGTGSVSCNSVFALHLGRFLNKEELMEHEATVQNP